MVDDFYNIPMERATILIAQNQPMLDIEKLRESAHLLVYALSESDLLAVTWKQIKSWLEPLASFYKDYF